MATVDSGSADQSSGLGGWTHERIIGEHQQYFFKRLLKLDAYLLQEMVSNKVIIKKQRAAIEQSNYDMDLFLAIMKAKKVNKFVIFLQVLEATFSWNANHRALVSTMAEHLTQMSGVDETQKVIIKRVVCNATIGSGTLKKTEAKSKAECDTPIESESQIETKFTPLKKSQTLERDVGYSFPSTMLTGTVPEPEQSLKDKLAAVGPTQHLESNFATKLQNTPISPPKGFIEPRHVQYFSVDNLVSDTWTFHSVEHGVTIKIHKDSVPTDKFALSMHSYLWGPFEIPDEYEICTAMFLLQVHPYFKFLKSVSVRIPNSVLYDDDDLDEDFIVLRAPDPHTFSDPYQFSDVISADYSEDYYVQFELEHFCAVVGAKRRHRTRKCKGSNARKSSITKERRVRKSTWRKRMKNSIEKGDSISSTEQSSYEERDAQQLKRQMAIDETPCKTEGQSCNQVRILCCSPLQRSTHWTTQFMIAPNVPTGVLALNVATDKFLKRNGYTEKETMTHVATPLNHYIGFQPGRWSDNNWMVNALTTPQMHLSQLRSTDSGPSYIDFDIKCTNHISDTPLYHEITITGADADDKRIYFIIKSEDKPVKEVRSYVIRTESWLYQDNNTSVLEALTNTSETVVNLSQPDHYKLLADIALQLPKRLYGDLLREFGFSEAMCDQLEEGELSNLPERVYKALYAYAGHRDSLPKLKFVLAKIGVGDIELCKSDIPLLNHHPTLNEKICDNDLCLSVVKNGLAGKQWRFVGRFLGLSKVDIDELTLVAEKQGCKEAVYKMLSKWQQQGGELATVAALVKVIYRIHQLNPEVICEVWWWLETELGS